MFPIWLIQLKHDKTLILHSILTFHSNFEQLVILKEKIFVSTVTPVYCGAKYLKELVNELELVRENWSTNYPGLELVESIFVLDDPVDNSAEILEELKFNRDWLKVIILSKNAGQHSATMAGILYSVGDWIITLDEDLQHHPRHFIDLLHVVAKNTVDICYAHNLKRTHDSIIRDTLARTFKKWIGIILGNKNTRYFNSFRLIRGELARAASSIAGYNSYFDILLSWFTNKVKSLELELIDKRNTLDEGKSGYSILGLIKHAKRMIFTSNLKVLRIGIFIGLAAFLISLLMIGYAIAAWIFFEDADLNRGWYSTFSSILFFGGLTSLLIGLLLESISHILMNSQGKPTFYQISRKKDKFLIQILEGKH